MSKVKTHGVDVYERAKERFDYNPLTGNIIHIEDTRRNKVGDIIGRLDSYGYLIVEAIMDDGKRKQIRSHRLAFYIMEGHLPEQIDHVDGDRANNKWFNLRSCTNAENSMNKGIRKGNTSGYRGVGRHQGKWIGRVMINNKINSKSGFSTPSLANDWVVAKSKELFGEFYNENRYKEDTCTTK